MKKYLFLILSFCIIGCQAQAQTAQKFNLGFEKHSDKNALADAWFKFGGNGVLSIDSICKHSGLNSGKISSTKDGSFGSIAYRIPCTKYEGKTIKLEGYMKIKEVKDGFAGLLLRIDGNGKSLAFDNMQRQNISGTKDWQKYSVTLDYPEGAEKIFVAGILSGRGEAWFDDFVVTIDGNDIQILKESDKPIEKAKLDKEFDNGSNIEMSELATDAIDNLELLGRIWGFLKYHHPEIAKGNYNWDYELFRFLTVYLKTDATNGERELLSWINSLGEIEECENCKKTDKDAFLKPDLEWIDKTIRNDSLKEKLLYIYKNRNQGEQFYIEMTPYVGNPIFKNENAYNNMPYPDSGYRLLSLFKYWNMINYFFPYKHLMDKDWNQTLKEYIPKFINAQNELEYELAAIQIIGDIQDTHANLWGGKNAIEEWRGKYYPPMHIRFIENKLVVVDYYNPEFKNQSGLEIGDVITKINGQYIKDIIAEISKFYPASNEPTRLRDISAGILRSQKNEIEISYLQNGVEKDSKLKLYPRDSLNIYHWYKIDNNEKSYRFLDDNIGYITLKTIKDSDFDKIKEEFKDAKGIIIDIRNYPSAFAPFALGSFFMSSSTPFVKFTNGNIDNPGEFIFRSTIKIKKDRKHYKGKLIVIVNELSQSQAEYTAMAFRAGINTTIIGSTTAGADGNVSRITLPGGLSTMISGIGVYYPDGQETQRVGIVPDIEVKPTIKGIRDGRDELLEKAIELIMDE